MPKALEEKLRREAIKKFGGSKGSEDRRDRYIYSVLRSTGWKPSRKKK